MVKYFYLFLLYRSTKKDNKNVIKTVVEIPFNLKFTVLSLVFKTKVSFIAFNFLSNQSF